MSPTIMRWCHAEHQCFNPLRWEQVTGCRRTSFGLARCISFFRLFANVGCDFPDLFLKILAGLAKFASRAHVVNWSATIQMFVLRFTLSAHVARTTQAPTMFILQRSLSDTTTLGARAGASSELLCDKFAIGSPDSPDALHPSVDACTSCAPVSPPTEHPILVLRKSRILSVSAVVGRMRSIQPSPTFAGTPVARRTPHGGSCASREASIARNMQEFRLLFVSDWSAS